MSKDVEDGALHERCHLHTGVVMYMLDADRLDRVCIGFGQVYVWEGCLGMDAGLMFLAKK